MLYSPPPQGEHTHYLNLADAVELGYGTYQTLRSWISQGHAARCQDRRAR